MKSLIAKRILWAMAIVGFAVPAFATSGENAGKVASFGAVSGVWEVAISGLGTLCPGRNWAYISGSDNNFLAEQNAITQAQHLSSNLYIYWTTDANGNCHITRLYY
jgi:hypothetical protein